MMSRGRLLLVCILIAGLEALPARVLAQNAATGSVTGTVHDATGAVLPRANVTITNNATGIVTKTTTSGSGDYRFPALAVGSYTIDVSAPTFEHFVVQNLQIHVGSSIRQDATLAIGAVNATIVVTPTTQMLQTETVETGQLIDSHQATELPIADRNIYRLLTLTAGAESGVANRATGGRNNFVLPGRPTIAGGRAGFTVFRVDGININNQNLPYASYNVSVDAVQEFRSVTALGAVSESGNSAVNLVTKSGANTLHGTLYEFLRNDWLDALPYFHITVPPAPGFQTKNDTLRYNQFGGTFGGPIWKNKTFFFGSVQVQRIRTSTQQRLVVPTAAELSGHFDSSVVDPITRQNFGSTASPYPTDPTTNSPTQYFDPANFSPFAKKLIGAGGIPSSNCDACLNIAGVNANYIANAPGNENDEQYFVRVDHHLSDHDSLFGTFLYEPHIYPQTVSPIPLFRMGFTNHAYGYNLSETHAFNPNLLNEFHLGYTRDYSGFGQESADAKGAFPLNNANFTLPSLYPTFSIIGMGNFGNGGGLGDSTAEIEDSINLIDGAIWTHNRHEVKAGFEGIKARFFYVLNVSSLMDYTSGLSGLGFTGNAFSDFLNGLPFLGITLQGNGAAPGVKRYIWDGYLQDTWKVHPQLTLTYGLRYEIQGRWRDVDGNLNRLSTLDTSAASAAIGGRFLLAGSANYYQPGVGVVQGSGSALVGSSIVRSQYNDLMPRVGVAWRPFTDNRTVVRGGFGLYYPVQDANRLASEILAPPFKYVVTFVNILPASNGGKPYHDTQFFPPATPIPGSEGENPGNRDPHTYEWTLGWSRQVTPNLVASLDYVGNHGIKLPLAYQANQAPLPSPSQLAALEASPSSNAAAAQARAPFTNVALKYLLVNNVATSSYHALNAKLEGRLGSRMSFTSVYTWSKSLDTASSEQDIPEDTYHLATARSYSTFDYPHRFVTSWVYELPFGDTVGRFSNPIVNGFIKGWETSGQLTLESGAPFSITVGADTAFRGDDQTNTIFVFPNQTGAIHKTNPRQNHGAYLIMDNLVAPPFGTLGTVRRDAFHGPGVNNLDFSMMKSTNLNERVKLQLRMELFNAFNHGQFTLADQTMYLPTINAPTTPGGQPTLTPKPAGTFGIVSQQTPVSGNGAPVSGSRIVQLGAKLIF